MQAFLEVLKYPTGHLISVTVILMHLPFSFLNPAGHETREHLPATRAVPSGQLVLLQTPLTREKYLEHWVRVQPLAEAVNPFGHSAWQPSAVFLKPAGQLTKTHWF